MIVAMHVLCHFHGQNTKKDKGSIKSLYQSMRILIVPDKFKGSLSAGEVASAIAEGWRRVRSEDEIVELPMSDGGDGFGKILGDLMGAGERRLESLDAAHRAIETGWRWIESSKTAIIESAETIGLAQLPKGHFHPFQLDTLGLANVVQAAAAAGATKLIMGVGGSATNDGGFGLARGLGWRFLDDQGQELLEWMDLDRLSTIEAPEGKKLFRSVKVALDVQNPLLGVHGASRVYGPQKGLLPENMEDAEKRLKRLADVVKKSLGVDLKNAPGAGAAGARQGEGIPKADDEGQARDVHGRQHRCGRSQQHQIRVGLTYLRCSLLFRKAGRKLARPQSREVHREWACLELAARGIDETAWHLA